MMVHVRRRDFIVGLSSALAASPFAAAAQVQRVGRLPVVGVLWHAGSAEEEGTNYKAIVTGFADLGYIDGQTIVLKHRFPNERPEQFRAMAAELAASADVIVTIGANGGPYAKDATQTVPIVFALMPDPLGSNMVKSLARPEANVTGLTNSAGDIIGKRLALLKEMLPGLSRVALLINANSQLASRYIATTGSAASDLGLSGDAFSWRGPDDLERVFREMKDGGIQAVIISPDGWAFTYRHVITRLAVEYNLPLSVYSRQTLMSGAFMSYGVDHDAICRRVAVYVDKLLKGTKPGDLPVEQPSKFEFLINLKVARAMGVQVRETVLARADEVIE